MKKFISIILALVMLLGMAVPAFAASTDYTYTHVKGSAWTYGYHYFHDGYCPVLTDDGWRYTDENGNIVDFGKGNYIYVFDFSEGYAAFINDDFKVGYMDTKGKVAIPAQYDPYDEGMGSLYVGRVVNGNILVYNADADDFSQINLKNKKVTKTLDPWDDSVRALISDTYGNNAGAEYVTLEIDGYEEEVAFSEGKAIIRCEDGMCIVKKNATSVKPVTPTETAKPKSFKDVAEARWSHDAIMEMVDLGLFTGMTTPDKNGVASFEPTGTMTVAQFVTVATRILYQDQLDAAEAGQYWYSKNYDVAIANGLIKATEFSIDDMTKNITREQMALIAVRTAAAQGDNSSTEAPDSIIPDIAQADSYYKSFVKYSYAMGLITGMDDAGNFAPKNTLTREQGAMVAYRLIHEEVRQYPVF